MKRVDYFGQIPEGFALDFYCEYTLEDQDNNVYKCQECGYLARFEADGPHENDWIWCPHCGMTIFVEEADEESGGD